MTIYDPNNPIMPGMPLDAQYRAAQAQDERGTLTEAPIPSPSVPVRIKRLKPDAAIPEYAHEDDAGFDLSSAEEAYISAGQQALIKTGLAFGIPKGYEIQLRPRSGLALKYGVTLTNSPATIDSGFVGEVGVIIRNTGKKPLKVDVGTKVCQGVLARVPKARFKEVDELDETDRGGSGFGSSDKAPDGAEFATEQIARMYR